MIFEKADGDSRAFINASASFDTAWALRALHHIANGLRQMHQESLVHQDLKPSNVLTFGKNSSKVGDVGRASDKSTVAPHDFFACAGDPTYAPPEALYRYTHPDWNARRMGCDCYLLGSMVLFFFMNVATTPAILSKMLPAHHFRVWADSYAQVLPYVRDAFDQVAKQLEHHVGTGLGKELAVVFRQLCDPDPDHRGHPADHAAIGNSYSLQRYVSKFDNLAKKAEMKLSW